MINLENIDIIDSKKIGYYFINQIKENNEYKITKSKINYKHKDAYPHMFKEVYKCSDDNECNENFLDYQKTIETYVKNVDLLNDTFNEFTYMKNKNITKGNIRIDLPQDLGKFRLEETIRCTYDPIYFIDNYYYIISPMYGKSIISMYTKQEGLLRSMIENDRVVTLASRQCGKALSLDTPILTPKGFVNMGDLKINDIIYDRNGKETKINYITDVMYNHDVYEITFDTGESIKADAEHLWTISHNNCRRNENGEREEITVNTLDLIEIQNKLQNYVKPSSVYIKHTKPINFKKQEVPIDPYVLGLWLGDGNSNDGRITSHKDDYKQYKTTFMKSGYDVSDLRIYENYGSDVAGNFNVVGLTTKLRKNNLKGNKHIPDIYYYNDIDTRLELLQGLMDSDGYCRKGGSCVFYQSDKDFIEYVKKLLISLGIKTRITIKKTDHKPCYMLTFTSNHLEVFKLERKLERQRLSKKHIKNDRIYIRNINKINTEPVKCLQVDNDEHLFLCGKTLIPTHNSTSYCMYACHTVCFKENQNILLLANKLSTAKGILARIKFAFELLPKWLKPGVKTWNKESVEFTNGCTITAFAASSDGARSEAANVLIIDEMAFIPANVVEELWQSAYPTISSSNNSKVILVSTPFGTGNMFYELYSAAITQQDNDNVIEKWTPYRIDWWDVPNRDEVWKEKQLVSFNYNLKRFGQEFGNCCSKNTEVTVRDRLTGQIFDITLEKLYNKLK